MENMIIATIRSTYKIKFSAIYFSFARIKKLNSEII